MADQVTLESRIETLEVLASLQGNQIKTLLGIVEEQHLQLTKLNEIVKLTSALLDSKIEGLKPKYEDFYPKDSQPK